MLGERYLRTKLEIFCPQPTQPAQLALNKSHLDNNKAATTQSDAWLLRCTVPELFMEKDSWEDLLNKLENGTAPLIEGMNIPGSFSDRNIR